MNSLYSELQWLPRPPQDFREKLKDLGNSTGPLGPELQSLASNALDLNQLSKLAKAIAKARASGKSLHPLVPFRLAVLSNSTIDLIVPALVASAARHGIALEVIQPSYDQVAQEALTPDSTSIKALPRRRANFFRHRARRRRLPADTSQWHQNQFECHLHFSKFRSTCGNALWKLRSRVAGTLRSLIDNVNRELAEYVLGSGDALLDVAGLAETVGLADWHNTHLWNMAKFSFSDELIPLYADHVARTVAAIRGKSRKVLILDLDNTVWGGVLGDDGLEGIKVAQGDATGEAHLAVQRLALDLRQRGIVAVSSKNTDDSAGSL